MGVCGTEPIDYLLWKGHSMTRKDYELIAQVLREASSLLYPDQSESLAEAFARALRREPNFDTARFLFAAQP